MVKSKNRKGIKGKEASKIRGETIMGERKTQN